jgi:hypothetical protein
MWHIPFIHALFLLTCMFYLHIVDDFYLQGILAQLKQKQWWETHYPDKLYKHDWFIALIIHAFSWSFAIMLPIIVYTLYKEQDIAMFYGTSLCLNACIHAITDNAKANQLKISLLQDQCIHFIQILITWAMYLVITSV